jgi:hypothetical protein
MAVYIPTLSEMSQRGYADFAEVARLCITAELTMSAPTLT